MAARDPDGRIGTVLDGRYRILEPLSRGGMGVVYRAERIPVGRPVAVKFLHALFADDHESRVRFERETRALSKLNHPHCVSIIDFGFDGAPYLVMELVGGATLRELIDDGPLPIDDAIALTRQLLAGLAHAHAEGIVHRDVKPANVMVTDEIGTGRHARILDFGLARLGGHGSSNITQASIVVGTPSYMAPEQTMGGAVDARTDVYAVGVLLFEMVTGQRPFVADDTGSLLEMHRRMPPPRLSEVDGETAWPAGLDAAIQRALEKEPDDRWQSAVEFSAELDAVARGEREGSSGRGGSGGRRSGRRVAAVLAVMLATGGAATAAYVTMADRGAGARATDADAATAAATAAAAATATATATATDAATDAAADAVADAETETDAVAVADAETETETDAVAETETETDVVAETVADAGLPFDDDDIELEPIAPADPDIEAIDPAPEPADGELVEPPPVAPMPVAPPKTARAAMALAKAGHRDEAIAGMRTLWKQRPRDANLPFLLGNLYHEKRWWSVAMEHYQAAIKRAAAYRRNSTLIRNVITMLGSPRTRAKASWFLRKIVGAPARAHLKHAVRHHKSIAVRKQATAVLRRF